MFTAVSIQVWKRLEYKKVNKRKLQLQKCLIFILMIDMIYIWLFKVAIYSSIHRFFDGHQLEVQAFLS